jgi:hypothetical protein
METPSYQSEKYVIDLMSNKHIDENMKKQVIKYFKKEGLKNPVKKFKDLNKTATAMGTSVNNIINVYLRDNTYNGLPFTTYRVCNLTYKNYPDKVDEYYSLQKPKTST